MKVIFNFNIVCYVFMVLEDAPNPTSLSHMSAIARFSSIPPLVVSTDAQRVQRKRKKARDLPVALIGSVTLHVVMAAVAINVAAKQPAEQTPMVATYEVFHLETTPVIEARPVLAPAPKAEPQAPPPKPHVLGAPARAVAEETTTDARPSEAAPMGDTPGDDSVYDDAGGGEVVAVDAADGQESPFAVRPGSGSGPGIGRAVRKGSSKIKPAVYSMSGVDTPPTVLSSARPSYPRSAERRRIEGWARVALLINAHGRVSQARVLSTRGHKAFGDAVLASIKSWQFQPATLSGQAVAVWATRTINFKMPRRR
ncbi:MAG: TonB family protein [Polyangiaceae bacterium]